MEPYFWGTGGPIVGIAFPSAILAHAWAKSNDRGYSVSSRFSMSYRPFGTASTVHDLFEIILLGGSE